MGNQNYVVGSGSKKARFYDKNKAATVKYETAIQLGIVKDNKSAGKDGSLRVWIPDFGGNEEDEKAWKTVNYANPFMGSTYQPTSNKNNNFTGVEHTYGMWFVPPDIGNMVLCAYVNGDADRAFWFACVQSKLSNWMVPAVGASSNVNTATASPDVKASILPASNVPPQVLPVAEFNENVDGTYNGTFYNNSKPVHETQAKILFQQGLDRDPVRGAISSSAQRESPSHVFGISTPGRPLTKDPADDPDYETKVNSGTLPEDQYSVPTRKGGHSFVMDDGDVNGDNQVVRLRTSGGHQILMNDTVGTIYISHKDGTSWAEIDTAGIKVYTAGDLSMRTEGVLNFHADKDINFQSGGTINMVSDTAFNLNSNQVNLGGSEGFLIYGGKVNIGGGQMTLSSDGTLDVSAGGLITVTGNGLNLNSTGGGNSISMPTLKLNALADTNFDDKVTKLWSSVSSSTNSICTLLPSHEPWTRAGATLPDGTVAGTTAAPLTKSVSSSVCEVKVAGTTTTTDQGIADASGKAVATPTCPAEYIAKTSTYSPASNFGASSPMISQKQAKAMMAELGYFLSQFNYSYVSSDGTKIGKYAVDAQYLVTAGYIKPDALKQYTTGTLANKNSWTGKDSIKSQDDFFNSPNTQDTIQYNEFTASYAALVANGGIQPTDDVCTAAGMMFVMHEYRTADATLKWRKSSDSSVPTSTLVDSTKVGTIMYNQGRYSIDVLAAGSAITSLAQTRGLNGPNTTGINPDDIFVFTGSGSSTRANFDAMNGTFKDAILTMGKAYIAIRGGKITITSCYRSPEYQNSMYQAWLAAGGPQAPGGRAYTTQFGWLTTPVPSSAGRPDSHGSGIAIDSGQSSLISSTVNLASYGLVWGGSFTKPDLVHIQLANS